MERVVIVGYKPKPGKEHALQELSKTHWERLNDENLVSERKPVIVRAKDGTVIEIFGWKSAEIMESAHNNPAILQMWKEYAEVCEYIPVSQIPECQNLFSDFAPLS